MTCDEAEALRALKHLRIVMNVLRYRAGLVSFRDYPVLRQVTGRIPGEHTLRQFLPCRCTMLELNGKTHLLPTRCLVHP